MVHGLPTRTLMAGHGQRAVLNLLRLTCVALEWMDEYTHCKRTSRVCVQRYSVLACMSS